MKKIAEIKYDQLILVYVSDFWDHPLSGLCNYNNKIHYFNSIYIDEECYYNIYELNRFELIKKLYNKWLFEICVGKHWSYKDGHKIQNHYECKKPYWFWHTIVFNLFYYKHTRKRIISIIKNHIRKICYWVINISLDIIEMLGCKFQMYGKEFELYEKKLKCIEKKIHWMLNRRYTYNSKKKRFEFSEYN